MSAREDRIGKDTVFELLKNARRRYVLSYLRGRDEPVEMKELAAAVAGWENDKPAEELTRSERKRAYVSLYQTHIPKLVEAGIVTRDDESGGIELTNRISEIDRYLPGRETERSVPWVWLYVGLTLVSWGAFLGTRLEVEPFAAIPPLALGTTIPFLFVLIAVVQHYWNGGYGGNGDWAA